MNSNPAQTNNDEGIEELSAAEVEQVHGGRTVYLDGMQVEMSDTALSGIINTGAAKAIVIKGVAHPFFQGVNW